jgi:hypothetical protein
MNRSEILLVSSALRDEPEGNAATCLHSKELPQ